MAHQHLFNLFPLHALRHCRERACALSRRPCQPGCTPRRLYLHVLARVWTSVPLSGSVCRDARLHALPALRSDMHTSQFLSQHISILHIFHLSHNSRDSPTYLTSHFPHTSHTSSRLFPHLILGGSLIPKYLPP